MPKEWEWGRVPPEADELLTSNQRNIMKRLRDGASYRSIAKELSVSANAVQNTKARIRAVLRKHDCSPETGYKILSDSPYSADRKTAHYKMNPESGELELSQVWVKPKVDQDKQEAMREFVDGLLEDIPQAKPSKASKGKKDPDLASMIVIGDAHIGCYVYGPEVKDRDFDTDIATREIREAVDDLVERSPPAKIGVLVDVGDAIHANTSHNATWSGTPLDVDTRYHRIMKSAGMVMRYSIDRMLQKFDEVLVVVAKGNHNPDAAVGVQLMLSFYYEKEKRVNVLDTEGWFHYIEFGKWLLQVNHGDKIKPEKAVSAMSRDMPVAWGRTTHRMCIRGHLHNEITKELDGAVVRVFGALPPPDSWHNSMGFGSRSTMELVCLKKGGGVHSTLVYNIDRNYAEPDARIA